MEVKQQILHKAGELFMRYGIKSVSMDDLARELGISKKTLYQYVENKADLIQQIFQEKIELEKQIMKEIRLSSVDAIDEILKIARYVTEELRQISPTTMYDLQKYYREVWKEMEALHKRHVYMLIRDNLERGVKQGFYRENMNPDIVAKLYVGKTSLVVDEDLFPTRDYDKSELFKEYIRYHINGVASPKGLKLLVQHLGKEQDQLKII